MDTFFAASTPEASAHHYIVYVATVLHTAQADPRPVKTRLLGRPNNPLSTKPSSQRPRHTVQSNATSAAVTSICLLGRVPNWKAYCTQNFFNVLSAADSDHSRRYSYDAIHNQIAHSRSPLQTGGYSRVSQRQPSPCPNQILMIRC